jgi:hypothetical protein
MINKLKQVQQHGWACFNIYLITYFKILIMKQISSTILIYALLIAAVLFNGCKKEEIVEDDPNPEVNNVIRTFGNNGTVVENNTILGKGYSEYALIWKSIDVQFINTQTSLEVKKMYITRSSKTDKYISWILPVKNISGLNMSELKLINITFKDNEDQTLLLDEVSIIHAQVAKDNSGEFRTTFLEKDHEGYFLGISEMPFSGIAKVEIENIGWQAPNNPVSPHNVYGINYTKRDWPSKVIDIIVKNESEVTLNVELSSLIYLNKFDEPIYWDIIKPPVTNNAWFKALAPQESDKFYFNNNYQNLAYKLIPIIGFHE